MSLKKGADMRLSEQRYMRPFSDYVYAEEMTVVNEKEFEWQLH